MDKITSAVGPHATRLEGDIKNGGVGTRGAGF